MLKVLTLKVFVFAMRNMLLVFDLPGSKKNVLFAIWFYIYTHAQLRISGEFQDSMNLKSVLTDYKRVNKIMESSVNLTLTDWVILLMLTFLILFCNAYNETK